MSKNTEQTMENRLLKLVHKYEEIPELQFLKEINLTKFNTEHLPSVVQDMVQLAVTRTAFPTVSSLAITNFVLSHLFGQLRPKINTPEYSPDVLGINTYSVVISRSGSSKDRTYSSLTKAARKATEYIDNKKKEESEKIARTHYIKTMKNSDPDFDEETVMRDDWESYIRPEIESTTDLQSTRGGICSDLNKLAKSKYGVTSLFDSEFALAVQTSETAVDIFKLISVLYDSGKSVAPSFKSNEAREESVDDAFMNLLGVTSAAPFYERGGRVRRILVPLLMTSLARRTTVVYNTPEEEFSNDYIPLTPEEEEKIEAENDLLSKKLQLSIDEDLLKAVKTIENNPVIMMDEEAGRLYKKYRSYTKNKAKYLLLKDGDSPKGLELAGQAFKLFRIAAVWTMAQNKTVVDVTTLRTAIEFAIYTAEHLERFNKTLQLTEYELFAQDWQDGFLGNEVAIDTAITRGYLITHQANKQSIENLLRLINSKLTGEATVVYSEQSNCFIFTPIIKNTENLYSYRASQGISDDRPVSNPILDRPLENLAKPLVIDSSLNPFVEDTTKIVMLTVKKSLLSMDMLNHYLADTKHWIATAENPEDEHSFNIILPINVHISKSDYKFVSMSIAEQLLLKVNPSDCEPNCVYHGRTGATQLTSNEGASLYDVSGILTNVATSSTVPRLSTKSTVKPTPSSVDKYLNKEVLDNIEIIIDIINISTNQLLIFAGLIYSMKVRWVSDEKIRDVIEQVNGSLENSISEETIESYVLEPFINL